jgi:hypothetical protein
MPGHAESAHIARPGTRSHSSSGFYTRYLHCSIFGVATREITGDIKRLLSHALMRMHVMDSEDGGGEWSSRA